MNKPWLNVIATVILGVLFMLSAILVVTTAFPAINVTLLLIVLVGLLLAAASPSGCSACAADPHSRRAEPPARRETWTMPPLALLGKPVWSRTRTLTMYLMYGYLAIAVVLLAVKAAQLAGH